MKKKSVVPVIALLVVLVVAGVFWSRGRQLPPWAPKNPSPEFLRAAKVLKPLPPEAHTSLDVPAWECFGALTDQQLKAFREARLITVQVATMSAVQRKAFDEIVKDNDVPHKLQRIGAAPDLSNVNLVFKVEGHEVWVGLLGCQTIQRQSPHTSTSSGFSLMLGPCGSICQK